MEKPVSQPKKIELIVFTKGKSFIFVPELVKDLADHGCEIIDSEFMFLSENDVKTHYAHVAENSWFPQTLKFYAKHPVFILKVRGTVESVKAVVGQETDPHACELFSFRAQHGTDLTDNACHRSGNEDDAAKEVERFFGDEGIVTKYRQNPEAQLEFYDRMVEYAKNVAWFSGAWSFILEDFGSPFFL